MSHQVTPMLDLITTKIAVSVVAKIDVISMTLNSSALLVFLVTQAVDIGSLQQVGLKEELSPLLILRAILTVP
jgi:hypothetical protein